MGYETYADFVLEERMAQRPDRVINFLEDLYGKSYEKAKEEKQELERFIKEELGEELEIQRWDWNYYSEKLRKKKYDFDDELIKPYFPLEGVIDGVFRTAERLYGNFFFSPE